MRFLSIVLLYCLLYLPVLQVSDAAVAGYNKDFNIVNVVKTCNIIAVGEVVSVDFVYRANIRPNFTTDVTILVEEMIKGKPNVGKHHIKFMLRGGTGVDPNTNEVVVTIDSDTPKFTVGERVMVLLLKNTRVNSKPHGGYFLFQGKYGKRRIVDNKTKLRYDLDNKKKLLNLPIDLIIQIGRAAAKDKEAAELIENDLKMQLKKSSGSEVVLSKSLVDGLKLRSRRIIRGD